MLQPIQIIVTAQTAQAAADLQKFAMGADAQLVGLLKQIEATNRFMANAMNNQLLSSGKVVTGVAAGIGAAAKESSGHIGGMVYQFRSAIDAIRFAAAGGGARAGFYAIDEAVRGLVASGMSLSKLVPVIGGVLAAVGAGYLVWHEWSEGEREAVEQAKELGEAWKGLIPLLKQINTLQKTGLISPESAQKYSDMLTHPGNYFVDEKGQITTSPTRTELQQQYTPTAVGPVAEAGMFQNVQIPNKTATSADVQKYVESQSPAAEVSKQQADALSAFQDDLRKSSEGIMSDLDKKIAEIHDKAAQAKQKLLSDAEVSQAQLDTVNFQSPKKLQETKTASNQIDQAANTQIAAAQQEAAQKTAEQQNKVREQYAKEFAEANKQIDDQMTADAVDSGAKQTDSYRKEFVERAALALKFYLTGKISEQQYDDAVAAAQQKAIEGQKQFNAEAQRTLELKQALANVDTEAKLKAIEGNPLLSTPQKAQQSIPLLQSKLNDNSTLQSFYQGVASNPASSDEARIDALEKTKQLMLDQVDLTQKLNEAQGQTSFAFQFSAQIAAIQSQYGTWASSFASDFKGLVETTSSSITSNISGWIEGTKSWGQAWRNIFQSISSEVIQSLVQTAVQQGIIENLMTLMHIQGEQARTAASAEGTEERNLITFSETVWHGIQVAARTVAHVAGEGLKTGASALGTLARNLITAGETLFHAIAVAARTAAHIASELLMTAISAAQTAMRIALIVAESMKMLVGAAIGAMKALASIPYVGPVLAVAAAAAILAEGAHLLGAYDKGGYTGDGPPSEVAGFVHRGEFVVPADAVDRIGVGNLQAMTSGASSGRTGGAVGQQTGGTKVHNHINIANIDGKSDAQRWADGNEGDTWFASKLDQHVQRYTKKS